MMMIVFMNKCYKKKCFGLTIWLPWWWWLWWWWLPNPKSGPVGRNRVPSCHILYRLWYQWVGFDKFNSNINHEVNENGLINSIQISTTMSVSRVFKYPPERWTQTALGDASHSMQVIGGIVSSIQFDCQWGFHDVWPENLTPDSFFRTQTDYYNTFLYVSIHFFVNSVYWISDE